MQQGEIGERFWRWAGLAAMLLLCVSAELPAAAEPEQKPLRWAADAEGGAPYILKDPDHPDKYIGFEVDIAEALERQLGRKIEFVQYDFKSLVPGLMRGDFDFAMNGLEVTPDRVKSLRFTQPYYIYTLQLVVRKGDSRIRTLDGCKRLGALVGTLEDTAAERLLDKEGIKNKSFGNQVEPYVDLDLGRLDAVLLDTPIAAYYAKPYPEKYQYAGPPLGAGLYAIAFRKDRESLAAQFDVALQQLIKSGTLKQIYEKWNIWTLEQEKLGNYESMEDQLRDATRNWSFFGYFPLLLDGARVTIIISVLGMALAMAIGLPLSLSRLYGPAPLRIAATVYVEFFRGIPVLLLLYFLYYGLPVISENYHLWFSMNLMPLQAAILGFGLNYGAYQAEIFRAGIASIPVGQWEAGISLGMSRLHTFRRIVLPQAVRVILPPITNDFVALFKDTSIVSIIAVVELNKQYQVLAKSSLKYLEIGLVTALLYLIMSVPLGHLSQHLEKKWGKGR